MIVQDLLGSVGKFFVGWAAEVLRWLWILLVVVSLPFAWLGGTTGLLIFVALGLAIASYRKPILICGSVAAYTLYYLTSYPYPFH